MQTAIRIERFRWDWMIFPGASFKEQLLLDFVVPLLIVALYRTGRFYTPPLEEDTSEPLWVRHSWRYMLVALYVWFFAATYHHFTIAAVAR